MKMFAHISKKTGRFQSIYGSKLQVSMCGTNEIVVIDVIEDEDGDYWGWKNLDGTFTMVFGSFNQFFVCFPYGIEVAEKRGKGVSTKLKITLKETNVLRINKS